MVNVIEKIFLFKVLNPDKPVEVTTRDFFFCFVACETIDFLKILVAGLPFEFKLVLVLELYCHSPLHTQ